MTCLFWVAYDTRYCPFLFRNSGEVNANFLSLFIETWQLDLTNDYKCSRFELEKFSKQGHYCWVVKMLPTVQGAHRHFLCQGDPYLPTGLGTCSLLAPTMPPEDSIDSAHGSSGAGSCPPPGGIRLPTALLCQLCLICSVTNGSCSSLKARWPPQHFFAEAFTRTLPLAELVQWQPPTQMWWQAAGNDTAVCKMNFCVYICMYILWPEHFSFRRKMTHCLQWADSPPLPSEVAISATVGGKQWPFS